MSDPDRDLLRAALEDDALSEDEVEAQIPPGTPLRVLREIANTDHGTARVQAARILLDREDKLRERRKQQAAESVDSTALDMAREVMALSDAELDEELRGFMTPLADEAPAPAITDAEIERRVQRRIDYLIAAGELVRPSMDDDPPDSADAGDDAVSWADPAPEEPASEAPAPPRGVFPDERAAAKRMDQARQDGRNPFDDVAGLWDPETNSVRR